MPSRFRKVFIVCADLSIFGNMTNVPMYKHRDEAEYQCKRAQAKTDEEQKMSYNAGKQKAKYKVHAFYLVHESVFRD